MTRPFGASIADWLGKTPADGGLGWGSGPVSVVLTALIVVLIAIVATTRVDVQAEPATDPV
ncbi:MAG TPA: hypothetical protein PLS63_08825 [Microthrixaceae bacterium]|nr:hypothetical protein [Microthrixaceae bacterium]